jgi:hypothetical protein
MTATYPFTRAKSAGWSTGERLTSTQTNTMDDNAASAADGALWTDIAIGKNWIGNATQANYGRALVWWQPDQKWFTLGVSGGNPLAAWKFNGNATWTTGLTIDAGDGLTPLCAVSNGTNMMVCGGTPGIASTSKLRSSPTGATWTARTTTAAGTESVRDLIYHSSTGHFVASLDNAAATNIEYSTNGTSWTQKTGLPNSAARGKMATSGSMIVAISYNTSTNKCITCTDPSGTWTERTLPTTEIWHGVYWDSVYERFLAFGATNFAYSDDGITWSNGGASPIAGAHSAAVIGRIAVGGLTAAEYVDVGHVIDTTATYEITLGVSGTTVQYAAAGNKQYMVSFANGAHFWTIAGGTLL